MCSLYCDVCNKPCEDIFFLKKDTSGYGSGVDVFFFHFLSKFDPKWVLSIKIYLIPTGET